MKYILLVASALVVLTSTADAQRRVAPRRGSPPVVTRPSDPTAYPWHLGNCVRVHFPQCSGGMDGGGF